MACIDYECSNTYHAQPISDCANTLAISGIDSDDANLIFKIKNTLGNTQVLEADCENGNVILDLNDLPSGFINPYKSYFLTVFNGNEQVSILFNEDIYNKVLIDVEPINPINENEYLR